MITLTLTQAEIDDLTRLLKDEPDLKPLLDRLTANTPKTAAQTFKLGATSLARLKGVHPDLVKVVLAWNNAIQFERLSPMVAGIATALGWSDEQLDTLFEAAALKTA